MPTEQLRRLLEIDQERKNLASRDKKLSGERMAIEEIILDEWIAEGVTGTKLNGTTISLNNTLRCRVRSDIDSQTLENAFTVNGLGWLLKSTVHAGSLTSYVKEAIEAGGVPEGVASVIHQDTVSKITCYGIKAKGIKDNG